jgi:peroxin-5
MSFLGGAECSTGANPLSQIQKHVQEDSSLQRDRLGARGPGAGLGGFRNAGPAVSQDDVSSQLLPLADASSSH